METPNVGLLRKARLDIKETLELHGIKAVDYNEMNILAPVAVIVPDEMYILPPSPKQKMNEMNVGISILAVASPGVKTENGNELDDLLEKIIIILNEYMTIDYASSPGKVDINKKQHLGSVIHVQYQIKLGEDK